MKITRFLSVFLSCSSMFLACSDDNSKSSNTPADDSDSTPSGPQTIGGTVSGLVGNAEIYLYNNATDELLVVSNGDFQFATSLEGGSVYEMSVDASLHYDGCELSNESGVVGEAAVTDITVECDSIPSYLGVDTEASVVIGQANFSDNAWGTLFSQASGNAAYANGILFVADPNSYRILMFDGIPTENSAEPSAVLGKDNFDDLNIVSTTAATFHHPYDLSTDGTRLAIADYGHSRVLIYSTLPTAEGGVVNSDIVLGQNGDFETSDSAAGADGLSGPNGVFIGAGKLLVADTDNHRVLIWDSIPTSSDASPDWVLGQSNFDNTDDDCTSTTLHSPKGVWTDGTHILVADSANNRVLLWNTWPTSNGAAADVVLGQSDAESSATICEDTSLNAPTKVTSNGTQIFVADTGNSRVLVWDSFPTEDGVGADYVLGQADTDACDGEAASARTLDQPKGVALVGIQLLVTDASNSRVLIFDSL